MTVCLIDTRAKLHFGLFKKKHLIRTESVTGFVLPGADVESCEEDGMVVVSALPTSQGGLPVAETVQRVVCMVVDHQAVL